MPTNTISVGLDKQEKPYAVDVIDHGEIVVHKHTQATKLVWILNEDLANGQFADLEGTAPGFEWVLPPPPGIFSEPTLEAKGKHLVITDNHSDTKSTGGPWIYKLRVVDGNTIYTTTSEYSHGVTASSKDPVIINKDP